MSDNNSVDFTQSGRLSVPSLEIVFIQTSEWNYVNEMVKEIDQSNESIWKPHIFAVLGISSLVNLIFSVIKLVKNPTSLMWCEVDSLFVLFILSIVFFFITFKSDTYRSNNIKTTTKNILKFSKMVDDRTKLIVDNTKQT